MLIVFVTGSDCDESERKGGEGRRRARDTRINNHKQHKFRVYDSLPWQ